MSEALEHLNHMGLPAAVLQALLPCSPSLRPPEPPRRAAVSDVDRYTSGTVTVQPEPVVTELRAIAERHQAHQAARLPEAA